MVAYCDNLCYLRFDQHHLFIKYILEVKNFHQFGLQLVHEEWWWVPKPEKTSWEPLSYIKSNISTALDEFWFCNKFGQICRCSSTPSKVWWMLSFLIRPDPPQKVYQLSTKPTFLDTTLIASDLVMTCSVSFLVTFNSES